MTFESRDLQSFQRLLTRTRGEGFRLVVVELYTPTERSDLLRWLELHAGPPIREVDAKGDFRQNPVQALKGLHPPVTPQDILVISGLETTERSDEGERAGVLQALNVQRDTLVAEAPCIWLLVLHPTLRAQAQRVAPDFLDYATLWLEAARETAPTWEMLPDLPLLGRDAAWAPVPWEGLSSAGKALMDAAWSHLGRGERDKVPDLLLRVGLAEGPSPTAQASVALVEAWLRRDQDHASSLVPTFLELAQHRALCPGVQAVAHVGAALACQDLGELQRCLSILDEAETQADSLWRLEIQDLRLSHWVGVGEMDRALPALESLEAAWRAVGSELGEAQAQRKRASVLVHQGLVDEALALLECKVLPTFDRLDQPQLRAQTQLDIAGLLIRQGRLDEAQERITNEVIPVFARTQEGLGYAQARQRIAELLYARGHIRQSLQILTDEVTPAYEKFGAQRLKTQARLMVALILAEQGRVTEALQLIRSEILPQIDDGYEWFRTVTLSRMADLLIHRGDLDEALQICTKFVLPAYLRIGYKRGLAIVHGRIAAIREAQGKLDEALRIRLEDELPVYDQITDRRNQATAEMRVAGIYYQQQKYPQALSLLQERVLPSLSTLGDRRLYAIAQQLVAHIEADQGRPKQALLIYRTEVLPRFEALANPADIAGAKMSMAAIHYNRGEGADAKHARRLLEQAIETFKLHGLDADAQKAQSILRQLQSGEGPSRLLPR